jgi:hypothetical protein
MINFFLRLNTKRFRAMGGYTHGIGLREVDIF